MTRRITSILAGLLCLSCLAAPLSVSAKILNEEIVNTSTENKVEFNVTVESDLFHYTGKYNYYHASAPTLTSYKGNLETELTKANFVVTHVSYRQDTSEPTSYKLNGLYGDSTYFMAGANAAKVSQCLDEPLRVGDLVYIDLKTIITIATCPVGLDINPFMGDGSIMNTVIEYCGSGYDVFGDDFRKIMRYELYGTPWEGEVSDYADLPVEKGDITGDDKVDLVDVVSVSKHVMNGYEIGFYGRLCADVDNNGTVDEVDSLNILKSIIGLVDLNELS